LGCGEKGIEEIKDHPFFESIDWGLLEAGYLDPPFVPNVCARLIEHTFCSVLFVGCVVLLFLLSHPALCFRSSLFVLQLNRIAIESPLPQPSNQSINLQIVQKFDVNAASLKDIGDFDKAKYKNVKLDDRFRQRVKNFHFVSIRALQVTSSLGFALSLRCSKHCCVLQDEMVSVLEKADENVNFEKFAPTHPELKATPQTQAAKCCSIV